MDFLGSSEFCSRDIVNGGAESGPLESVGGVLVYSMMINHLCQLVSCVHRWLERAGIEADCFGTTASSQCVRAGIVLASSIKHGGSLLQSQHSGSWGLCGVGIGELA